MIGSKLKELRNKHKYTISQLCELLDFNPNTYAKYERDERDVSTETLSRLASFYNVSTDYLLGRDTSEKPAIDLLAAQFDMSALEQEIIKGYLDLPENMRDNLMDFLERAVRKVQAGSIPTPMIARSSDDRPPGVMMLTPEQKKRLDEAPDETQNPDNDI